MPGRTPMKTSMSSGLRRMSLVRSAARRSGLARIPATCSRDNAAAPSAGGAFDPTVAHAPSTSMPSARIARETSSCVVECVRARRFIVLVPGSFGVRTPACGHGRLLLRIVWSMMRFLFFAQRLADQALGKDSLAQLETDVEQHAE